MVLGRGAVKAQDLRLYLSLGDSMSIDDYPVKDAATRHPGRATHGLGAASLLFRNEDELWPELAGRDLETLFGRPRFLCLASDGAETVHVLTEQIGQLPADPGGQVLLTLTAGGNDLLRNLWSEGGWELLVEQTVDNLRRIVREIKKRYRHPILVLSTVYDPSDGSGVLDDGGAADPEALRWLAVYNDAVRSAAAETECLLADVYQRFFSHGLSEPDPTKRWYWEESVIEPGLPGAHQLRLLWLECLGLGVRPHGSRRSPSAC